MKATAATMAKIADATSISMRLNPAPSRRPEPLSLNTLSSVPPPGAGGWPSPPSKSRRGDRHGLRPSQLRPGQSDRDPDAGGRAEVRRARTHRQQGHGG